MLGGHVAIGPRYPIYPPTLKVLTDSKRALQGRTCRTAISEKIITTKIIHGRHVAHKLAHLTLYCGFRFGGVYQTGCHAAAASNVMCCIFLHENLASKLRLCGFVCCFSFSDTVPVVLPYVHGREFSFIRWLSL
jgi:hypothetical protein